MLDKNLTQLLPNNLPKDAKQLDLEEEGLLLEFLEDAKIEDFFTWCFPVAAFTRSLSLVVQIFLLPRTGSSLEAGRHVIGRAVVRVLVVRFRSL